MKRLLLTLSMLLFPALLWGQVIYQIDTLKSLAAWDGSPYNYTNNYLTTRNATAGNTVAATDLHMGQNFADPNYVVYRGFLLFDLSTISPLNSVDSVRIDLSGNSIAPTTDFDITTRSGYFTAFAKEDWDLFDGWAATGAYGGVALTDNWNSTNFVDGAYNKVGTLTSAGVDTIEAHLSDSLKIVLLSGEDIAPSEPTDDEYLIFYTGSQANKEPLLIIYSSEAAVGLINTRSRGNVLREATGKEFPAMSNPGKLINRARIKP